MDYGRARKIAEDLLRDAAVGEADAQCSWAVS